MSTDAQSHRECKGGLCNPTLLITSGKCISHTHYTLQWNPISAENYALTSLFAHISTHKNHNQIWVSFSFGYTNQLNGGRVALVMAVAMEMAAVAVVAATPIKANTWIFYSHYVIILNQFSPINQCGHILASEIRSVQWRVADMPNYIKWLG